MATTTTPTPTRPYLILTFICLLLLLNTTNAFRTFACKDQKCTKETIDDPSSAVSIQECKLKCLPYGGLLPAPTKGVTISQDLITVSIDNIAWEITTAVSDDVKNVVLKAQEVFVSRLKGKSLSTDETYKISIQLKIVNPNVTYYTYKEQEDYTISSSAVVKGDAKQVTVAISGSSYLGVRHGLETLAQLIVYDDLHERSRMPKTIEIADQPFYKHRGMSLDTARSYMPVATILEVLDAMSQNKLNSLHWHITDTHSFPYVSDAFPILSADGAYSKEQIYTPDDISKIVEFARVRGVRVTPELDAPAHVGEGWVSLDPSVITCFKWEPWTQYCVEPPCGQFNPTKDRLYDLLHTIYLEWGKLFKSDLFHMGGDEVNLNCWKSTNDITTWMAANNLTIDDKGLVQLWTMYQQKSLAQLKDAYADDPTPVLWTSTLTDQSTVTKLISPSEYIIQIWTKKDDQNIAKLIREKYRLIFSNYDELYFDCGGAAWIGGNGQNWCSPYVGWQGVYGHDPLTLVQNLNVPITEEVESLVLGSEAALWTEQVDEQLVQGRLWPRGAALAERLWTRPSWNWAEAQYRMNNHRDRLARNGVRAELLQPQWCLQNDGFCGTGGYPASGMDITLIFKTCVKTIRTRNRACGYPEYERPKGENRKPDVFSSRAREVLHKAATLGAFVAEISPAYGNFSDLIPGAPHMTNLERDRIDVGVPKLGAEAKKNLKDLENILSTLEVPAQQKEHQLGVINLIKGYIRNVVNEHSELRAERVARSNEAKRMARLDTRTYSEHSSSEKPAIPSWSPEEEEVSVETLTAEELQMFEQENAVLQAELSGLASELQHLEGTITVVARLQEEFTEKIVEQEKEIDHVATTVINTTETIKDANEQLRQAIQRNAGLRVYVLFFLLVMSFSLLFLDWYND